MTQELTFNLDQFLLDLVSVQNTPGKNDKRALLLNLTSTCPTSKEILSLALNPRTPMYIGEEASLSKIRSIESAEVLSEAEIETATSLSLSMLMEHLYNETIQRGHKALAAIRLFLEEQCDSTTKMELVISLIQKNPRLGVSWHSFTKVTGTDKFEVMLAKDINKIKKMDEKVQFPVYVQPKLDGYRAVSNTSGDYELKSRNGKVYENFPQIVEALREIGYDEDCVDGEIMSDDFQSMQRTAFATKKKRTVGDVRYHIFDHIQDNEFSRKACYRNFLLRLPEIEKYRDKHPLIKVVETIRCESWEEVYAAHEVFKEQGYEGTIVRLNKCYEFKRTDSLMKIKEMLSQDCRIGQVIRGKGKNKEIMGAIRVIQEDGQTMCEVGTGFTDEMRVSFWDKKDELIDKVVEIKYQELTPDGVMRFPVFLRFREDKDE